MLQKFKVLFSRLLRVITRDNLKWLEGKKLRIRESLSKILD